MAESVFPRDRNHPNLKEVYIGKPRVFEDKRREVEQEYREIADQYDGTNGDSIKPRLEECISKDPNFFEPYLLYHQILQDQGKAAATSEYLDRAYQRAINLITDDEDNWPDELPWAWLENRHILQTLLTKALSLWDEGKDEEALDLLRRLLGVNPPDNVGARYYILGIKEGTTFAEFENRFNKGGFYDEEVSDWFQSNKDKYPNEFEELD